MQEGLRPYLLKKRGKAAHDLFIFPALIEKNDVWSHLKL